MRVLVFAHGCHVRQPCQTPLIRPGRIVLAQCLPVCESNQRCTIIHFLRTGFVFLEICGFGEKREPVAECDPIVFALQSKKVRCAVPELVRRIKAKLYVNSCRAEPRSQHLQCHNPRSNASTKPRVGVRDFQVSEVTRIFDSPGQASRFRTVTGLCVELSFSVTISRKNVAIERNN